MTDAAGNPGDLQVIDARNLIICTACPTPQPLVVTSNTVVHCDDQLCATIADCAPGTNIKPFAGCAITGGPCSPSPVGMWGPGSAVTTHLDQKALRKSDTLACAVGGTISVMSAGQSRMFVA